MADEIQVSGLSELRDTLLKRLPEAIQGKASQAALAKASRPMVEAAKQKAPSGFVGPMQPGKAARGRLRDAIASWRNRESTKTYESRFVGVRRRAWYWRFIEFGRGEIQKENGSLGTPADGFFGKVVKAVAARPFLRPAFEEHKLRAIEIYSQALRPAIEKVAATNQRRTIKRLINKLTGF